MAPLPRDIHTAVCYFPPTSLDFSLDNDLDMDRYIDLYEDIV